MYSSSAQSLL